MSKPDVTRGQAELVNATMKLCQRLRNEIEVPWNTGNITQGYQLGQWKVTLDVAEKALHQVILTGGITLDLPEFVAIIERDEDESDTGTSEEA